MYAQPSQWRRKGERIVERQQQLEVALCPHFFYRDFVQSFPILAGLVPGPYPVQTIRSEAAGRVQR